MKFWVQACLVAQLCLGVGWAANLTTTNSQPNGSWNDLIWKTNGAGTAVGPPVPGNTYQCLANGVSFGAGTSNTRIRNPISGGLTTFPGDSLTLNTNTEIRLKTASGLLVNFPGVGGNPGLILNGGVLNAGDEVVFVITGKVQVASQSYLCPADVGGGAVRPQRGFNISAQLSGGGNLVVMNSSNIVAQEITGSANTFSGKWIIKAGWLLASGLNSLGTNDIICDPFYALPSSFNPNLTAISGPALLEINYDINSAGKLILTNGGMMKLHQNCSFTSVTIDRTTLSNGTYYYADLAASFPNNFATSGSGSITVQPYGPPTDVAPTITTQPASATLTLGTSTQLVASATGSLPMYYRWQKGTNNVYVNASDSGDVTGSTTAVLNFGGATFSDAADYRLVVTNSIGSATSVVATVTVLPPPTNNPTVATLNPAAGATVGSLTQIQVTFSRNVVGVDPEDLLINGLPAESVSGSGSTYVFTFTQPPPGTVFVTWDIESAITDQSGGYFDTSVSWTYTLLDSSPPGIAATAPLAGATVGSLPQAQVIFSEPVSGVDASDFLINGVAATTVNGSGFGPYEFQFSQPAPGTVQFSWSGTHNIRDTSSNLFGGAGWSVALNPSAATAALTNIVINEFLAANSSTSGLADEDGQRTDWIELHNRGASSVNVAGWSLTDDAEQPAKWTLPATNIGPGQFLVVFASGKDRRVSGARLHTSFALNATGEYLALYGPAFPPQLAQEFAPEYPEQRNDYSYGLSSGGTLRYFATPTPGAPNSASTVTSVVANVHFSVGAGFFNQPFNAVLTTITPGATIVYTTNGSEPSITGSVTNGLVYSAPLNVNKTTALRAAAFTPNLLPSLIGSRSYFFLEDIVRQPNAPVGYPTGNVWTPTPGTIQTGSRAYYQMDPVIVNNPQYSNSVRSGLLSLPTMSIMLPIADLFDANIGIYSHPQSRGAGWERTCSMELVFPDGSDGLQLDCGLQIQGGTQREPGKNPKHSFRVNFKGDYGASELEFPIFPDSAAERFNTLVLDGGINMWWHYVGASAPADQRYRAQCVRDQFTSDLMLALGHPSFHGRFYHLYLNGLYWGIHYIHERPDDAFAETYFGGSRTNYDVIRNTTVGTEVVEGNLIAWNAVLNLSNSGLTNNAQYAQLQEYVDVENLIDYLIVNHWVENTDWPHHNWYVIRERAPGATFKFMIWDAEHVLKNVNNIAPLTDVDAGTPGQIYAALRNNAEFRLLFADHLQKHFFNGGVFYTDPANPLPNPTRPERNVPAALYMKRITEITNAIVDESARWGGYTLTTNYTRNDHWLRELNNLLGYSSNPGNTANYFPQRSATVLNQYRNLGLFPSVSAPAFSSQGGIVPVNFSLTMTNPNAGGKIYYTANGTDPRVYGSGAVSFGALAYTNGSPVILRSNTVVNARVLNGGVWSALNQAVFSVESLGVPIRFTEIMYNPVDGDAYEFIELQNIGAVAVDMGGFSFDGITFVFPDGSSLGSGGVIVLASSANPAAFAARYPGVAVTGYYDGQLSNGGERIALLDRNGNTVVSVEYEDAGGWPTAPDGGGQALEIMDPNGDPDDPANWRASPSANGSPGLATTILPLNAVRLNEVMAENFGAATNGGTFPDWIELHNAGTNNVNLANWSLSNSGNARKFVFPGTTIPAGGYLVVWCDSQTNAPGLHSGFNLGRNGESLFLYDAATNRVDAFSFGLQLTNYTVGRVGPAAAWQLNVPTPGTNNVAAAMGGATNLVINEWLANAVTGASDWLELYNASPDRPVALEGLYLATSNQLFQIRSLSFVGPRDFVQLFADENPGFDHLDFKLTAAGDAIALYDSGQQIDRVSFANQLEGVSQGRLPNGSATIVSFPTSSSPGASNYVSTYTGPRLNEIMARNVSAVYDSRGNNPDWIEMHNPNGTSFSLAGMGLSTDPSKVQWIFPSGVSIGANSYLVVWFDSSRPASTNADPELNTGRALSADGEGVYLFNGSGQLVDSVAFGFQIADVSIGNNGGTWTLLSSPTPGTANSAGAPLGNIANLRINEWMPNPAGGNDWFELHNTDAAPVSLSGLYVTDDPSITGLTNSRIASLSFIAPRGWVKIVADGAPASGPAHVNFNLDADGETIRLYSSNLTLIDAVDFGLQTSGVSQGRLPDGGNTIVNFVATPTPAASNYLPLQNVVVNEVLTHTDLPLEDAIELYNTASNSVTIGGWFISNSEADFKKFRIPTGVAIAGGDYRVFYEYQFNGSNTVPFTLNAAHGDSVFVSEADALGNLTGYRAQVSFGAASNSVSFGRFVTSAGVDFVAMNNRTFGADNATAVSQFRTGTGLTNSAPRLSRVVINEIMYHPVTFIGTNASENSDEEFIELLNNSGSVAPLYDPLAATNRWKLGGAIDFVFPANVSLPANGYAIVVGFDPADAVTLANFQNKYGIGTNVSIYGPYEGRLDNAGESVQLFVPDSPQAAGHPDAGFVPYVLADFVSYRDLAPWPSAADGTGLSLQRRTGASYGNEPLNWLACAPTPGAPLCQSDSDGDGLPDDWETANGLNPNSASGDEGADGNPDNDAFTNMQEFLAGTDPQSGQSYLRIDSIILVSGMPTLRFVAVAGRSYSIVYRDNLAGSLWQKLPGADVDAPAANTNIQVTDTSGGGLSRVYRLVTPKLP